METFQIEKRKNRKEGETKQHLMRYNIADIYVEFERRDAVVIKGKHRSCEQRHVSFSHNSHNSRG